MSARTTNVPRMLGKMEITFKTFSILGRRGGSVGLASTLDFASAHDFRVLRCGPVRGFSTQQGVSRTSLFSLSAPPLSHSLLSKERKKV